MIINNKRKIFCIGLNKTGTTTIEEVYKSLGFKTANQQIAEYFLKDWSKRNFKKLLLFCKTAQAFQDVPFSLPFTYIPLHTKYPNAKFILTIRENSDIWYNSLIKFHSKLWGNDDGIPPTAKQLQEAAFKYKGRAYFDNKVRYSTNDNDPYHKETLINYYESHNLNVQYFFKDIAEKLIIINVSKQDDYLKLCNFLEKDPVSDNFPWLNKSTNL